MLPTLERGHGWSGADPITGAVAPKQVSLSKHLDAGGVAVFYLWLLANMVFLQSNANAGPEYFFIS